MAIRLLHAVLPTPRTSRGRLNRRLSSLLCILRCLARKGLAWLEKSADAGNRDGQWLAGYVYMNGMPHAGIHKDERKAVAFLEKAAEQGSKHG